MKIPLIDRVAKKYIEQRYAIGDLDAAMDAVYGGIGTAAGVPVSEANALNYVIVFACVRVLAETLSSVPLNLYERMPRGKEKAVDHYLYPILHDAPNPEMTSYYFRETLQGHLGTWGNAYAEIDWGTNGRVRALWPLRPDKMKDIKRIDGTLYYQYRLPDEFSKDVLIPSYRILHIPFMGYNGIAGYNPISLARDAIGLGIAVEKYGSLFFSKGARPPGVLKAPQGKKIGPDAAELLRDSWEKMHQGLNNSQRTAILEDGLEYQRVGVPPEEAQFLQTRMFQKEDIATWYRIPQHMVGILEHATFSNIESQSLEFVTRTMLPWFTRWEGVLSQKLLGPAERKRFFIEFNVEGLLRGDTAARTAFYTAMFNIGVLSQNSILSIENMNTFEGGDEHWVPLNMVPISQALEEEGVSSRSEERANKNAGKLRLKTSDAFIGVFKEAAQRVVERERKNVSSAAKKMLSTGNAGNFNQWLDEYYKEFEPYIARKMKASMYGLSDAITKIAANEVNLEDPDTDKFREDYVKAYSERHVNSSRKQLDSILETSISEDDLGLEAIDIRLDEWQQKRAIKIADNETVRLSNAVTRNVFISAGITKLIWRNTGSDTCPFCQELDGKVVGIEQNFVDSDMNVNGQKLKVKSPRAHPPIHQGCVCQIEPQ